MRIPIDKNAFRLLGTNRYLVPRAGAKLYVYERGTTTEVNVYAASSGGSALIQPIEANDDGTFDAWITETDCPVDLYLPGDSVTATRPFGDAVAASIAAGGGAPLEVNDGDDVTVTPVTEIEVPDGTLTDNGSGKVTLTFSGGGGSSLTVTDGDTESVSDVDQIDFDGATVTDNEDGSVTVAGLKGEQGEKGDKGDKGDTGEQGEQGIQGEPGADGADGSEVVEAKGDLIVGTAAATIDNQPVGTDGHILTADSGQTRGVKWAAPSVVVTPGSGDNSGLTRPECGTWFVIGGSAEPADWDPIDVWIEIAS